MLPQVLLVEDDADLREVIALTLKHAHYHVQQADSVSQAKQTLQNKTVHVIVSDVNMPGATGFDLLHWVQATFPSLPIILMTAYGCVTDAVKAMRLGAVDYIQKPFEADILLAKLSALQPAIVDSGPVAHDPKSKQVLSLAARAAKKNVSILISGESGTGKEVLARYVHDHSPRNEQPFVAVNCAAIPDNMLEATLFGYEKGAFTGAYKSHAGKFEQAQGGTLLLDEISEMDLNLQAKLLRVIQEKEVERVGGTCAIQLDVRLIATTNRDLIHEIEKGTFRQDLYYRLNVFPLAWSPLRERTQDIIPMAEYLIAKHVRADHSSLKTLTEAAKQTLLEYAWPGNAREMDNVIQRALVVQTGDVIDVSDLAFPAKVETLPIVSSDQALSRHVKHHEYEVIMDMLNKMQGCRKTVAEQLCISTRTLRYKLAKMRMAGYEV